MKIRKIKSLISNDEGSAIGVFVIVLLFMTIMATTTVTLAQTQFTWSRFSRRTSNSYQLARSGAEKTIDSMNKEIAKVLPSLMDEASKAAHLILVADGVEYKQGVAPEGGFTGDEKYTGKYTGKLFENTYEIELRKLMYEHISAKFATYDILADTERKPVTAIFEATKSDVTSTSEVKINVYKEGDILDTDHENVDAIRAVINRLTTVAEIEANVEEDAFAVEVMAWAEEGTKTSLTKSHVIGTVSLDQLKKEEQLLEEYEWAEAFPEIFLSAITSFGDFIVDGNYKAMVKGDISVKGTSADTNAAGQIFPEPAEYGGIVVSDKGELKVEGNALVVNNIQTTSSNGGIEEPPPTKIHITQDAIAETVAINDNTLESDVPWINFVSKNSIEIGHNAYLENDLRIDRYVKKSEIKVGESVFGVSNGSNKGEKDPVTGKVYLDPNKSSGIYAMGKFETHNSLITMNRAFIAGQAFIDFEDGKGFHRLFESAGEPFEDVYYLDKYRIAYGEEKDEAGVEIEAHDDAYLVDFSDLIKSDRIEIGGGDAYAPAKISESGGPSHRPANFETYALGIFYAGFDGITFPHALMGSLTGASDWDDDILGLADNGKWIDVITSPLEFYKGNNPFKKEYIPEDNYPNLLAYKGLQGYMLAKRGVFYKGFMEDSNATSGFMPEEREFSDLINTDAFTDDIEWTRNNPIKVITAEGNSLINISEYKNKPTAIVATKASSVITLTSDTGLLGRQDFTGIIVTPGKIIVEGEMTINGVVIAGNEFEGGGAIPASIRQGDHAGIQIKSSNVTFKYDVNKVNPVTGKKDKNMLFDIHFMDKSLQRRLYDYLRLTNYGAGGATGRLDVIFGQADPGAPEGPVGDRKVKLSNQSVISSEQKGLQFTMKSLKKI